MSQLNLPASWAAAAEKYELECLLGRGSCGTVVKAKCKKSGRRVAIKQLSDISQSSYTAKKALREISILRHLSRQPGSEGITRLIDMFAAGNCVFLVLDCMEEDLASFLARKRGHLEESEVVKVLYGLLRSLAFLHRANVIHRDLKPQNVLIDADTLKVKLCDFGLSRTDPHPAPPEVTPYSKSQRRTLARQLADEAPDRRSRKRDLSNHVATRQYRAPEIILLEKRYDQSMDMWGLGCLLSELLFTTRHYSGRVTHELQLFPGTSCFPLSPRGANDPFDQLKVILKTLGDPREEDLSFLTDDQARDYVVDNCEGLDRIRFKEELPFSDARLVGMVQNLLNFNPHFRYKANELLQSSLFDEVRVPEDAGSVEPCQLAVDEAGAFDYGRCADVRYSQVEYQQLIMTLVGGQIDGI